MAWLPPQTFWSSTAIHGCPGAHDTKLAWSAQFMNRRAIYPTIHLKGTLLKGTSSCPLLGCGCSEEEEAASTTEPLLLAWKAQLGIQTLSLSPKTKGSGDRREKEALPSISLNTANHSRQSNTLIYQGSMACALAAISDALWLNNNLLSFCCTCY